MYWQGTGTGAHICSGNSIIGSYINAVEPIYLGTQTTGNFIRDCVLGLTSGTGPVVTNASTLSRSNNYFSNLYGGVSGNTISMGSYFIAEGIAPGTTSGGTGQYFSNHGATANVVDGGTISHSIIGTPRFVTVVGTVADQIVTVSSVSSTTITVAIRTVSGTSGTPQKIYWSATL
jgi:hypothetical protein